MLIDGAFDSRTRANMNVALGRVCGEAANGEDHSVRARVAKQIIRCARRGKVTLGDLTAAGKRGLFKIACRENGSIDAGDGRSAI